MASLLGRSAIAISLIFTAVPDMGLANTTSGHIEPLEVPAFHVRMRDVVAGRSYATDVSTGLSIPGGLWHRIKVGLGLADQRVLIAAGYSQKVRDYMIAKRCSVAGSYLEYYATIRPAQMRSEVGERLRHEEGRLPLYYVDEMRLVDPHACDAGRPGRVRLGQ